MRFKDHIHSVAHLNDFSVEQTELLVVIQNGVHVLDPVSIDRTIKHDPLTGAFRVFVDTTFEDRANYTVRELLRNQVVAAIQLIDGHALRVNDVRLDRQLFHFRVYHADLGNCALQNTVGGGFPTVGRPHKHQPMTTLNHLVKLDDLFCEGGLWL